MIKPRSTCLSTLPSSFLFTPSPGTNTSCQSPVTVLQSTCSTLVFETSCCSGPPVLPAAAQTGPRQPQLQFQHSLYLSICASIYRHKWGRSVGFVCALHCNSPPPPRPLPSAWIFTRDDEFLRRGPTQNVFSEQKPESLGQILLAKTNKLEADI